jgi:pimeloyl-ACP methyl ester carboxylesterase
MQCDISGRALFYETYGTGRPIVILSGRPSDHRSMVRFMEPLFAPRAGWLRLYPDWPGTGRSPAGDLPATHDALLDMILAFIDQIIPGQRFVLAGLSYGGYLARGAVYHRAAAIDGLLLCAPLVKTPPAQAQLPPPTPLVRDPPLLAQLEPGEARIIEELVVVQSPAVVAAAREVLAEVGIADHPFMAQLEAASPLSFAVDAPPAPFAGPTLIRTARQDNVCGYRDAWELLDHYPRATFAVLDRAGHWVDIEQAGLCHTLMREWLERVEEYAPPEHRRGESLP